MDFSCSYSVLLSSHASASYVRMSIIFISNIFQITSLPIPLSYLFLVSTNISCGVPCIVSLIRSIWDSKFPLLLMPMTTTNIYCQSSTESKRSIIHVRDRISMAATKNKHDDITTLQRVQK